MYHIPDNLPLSDAIGEFTTQICVGLADFQFTFGKINFIAMGQVDLLRNGELIGRWQEGNGLDSTFIDIINAALTRYEIPNDKEIVLYLEQGLEMHIMDDSDYHYEWLQITIEGTTDWWII